MELNDGMFFFTVNFAFLLFQIEMFVPISPFCQSFSVEAPYFLLTLPWLGEVSLQV